MADKKKTKSKVVSFLVNSIQIRTAPIFQPKTPHGRGGGEARFGSIQSDNDLII